MTSVECFRCGDSATIKFGSGYLCEGCVPDESGESTDDPDHENPIDVSDVADDERADMLREYLEAFVTEFDRVPRLMPLDEEGKAPIIQGRCRLDSPEGREYLVDGDEAIRRIREEGARGFAIYAGKHNHRTHGIAFVDHDDDSFPAPTGDPTLRVMSGSGRADGHETYRNDPEDPVANARVGDNVGEIRAENWYVVAPGSVHPSGGVYHVVENREIATLSDSDLTDEMRPSTGRSEKDVNDDATAFDKDGEGEIPDDNEISTRLEAAFNNPHDGEKIEQVYNGRYAAAGFSDRSGAEYWLTNHLDSWVGLGSERTVWRVMDRGNLQKWEERTDRSYRDSILSNVGRQDWYFDPEGDGESNENAYGKESVAVLPDSPDLKTASSGWDWKHAAERDQQTDPLQEPRDRTVEKIANAIRSRNRVLIEALPTLGKSYGAIAAAAETGEPVTLLTTRGNKEQYAQFEEWCEEHGLSYKRLPAFNRTCETARGHHGEEWKQTVMDWYNRGATPQAIHALAERTHGELPCQHDGQCAYSAAWDFDAEEFDVLIGHYKHAHTPKVVHSRTVMFDEFTEGAFETALDHGIEGAISYFVQQHDAIPFEDYTDLAENRHDTERRADALAFLADYVKEDDVQAVLLDKSAHAAAPAAALTILGGAKNDLGNGWERASFPDDDRIGLFDRETGAVSILQPPALDYAKGVIALDGTPTKDLWELTLGERLNRTQVLTDAERREYITEKLNLNLVRTTDAVKSYSPKASEIENRVSLREDTALLEGIGNQHEQRPSIITTKRAKRLYDDKGVLDLVDETKHYGDVLGSNQFDDERVGAVLGSRNFGPRYVEKWGAYLDETVEPVFPNPENDFTPTDYGEVGNRIRTHMREHETLQAAMRFGRDGNGAVVYVHTDTLPEWVPLAGEGRVLSTRSEGERQVIEAATDLEEWTTAAIADHPDVDIGVRQVRNVLTDLADAGVVEREIDGCGYVWRDTGLHRLNEHGDVEIDPVDLDDLPAEKSAEVARSTYNRWSFRTLRSSSESVRLATENTADSLGERGAVTTETDGPPPG